MHFSLKLGYSDYINDARNGEEREILDFIIKESSDCDIVVIMGDLFDVKNPPSSVIAKATEFIEMFNNKKVYIIRGNHCLKNDGSSNLEYLREIKNKEWKIIDDIYEEDGLVFCPYFTKGLLGVSNNDEAVIKIMGKLPKKGDILFHHYCMTGTFVQSGQSVNDFPEPVLPTEELLKRFNLNIGGHVHTGQINKNENVVVAGSVFNQEVNEIGKYIWKIDIDSKKVEKIKLPGRAIYGIEDEKKLDKIPKDSIVKFTLREKKTDNEIEQIKGKLSKFDAYVFLEKIKNIRDKMHYGKGESLLEFNIRDLLKLYSENNKINYNLLMIGFELINK